MSDQNSNILKGIIVEEHIELTLIEMTRLCALDQNQILELVEEGVLEPTGTAPPEWRFPQESFRRAVKAARLQSDLGVNLAGVALILDLLDEIEILRRRI